MSQQIQRDEEESDREKWKKDKVGEKLRKREKDEIHKNEERRKKGREQERKESK